MAGPPISGSGEVDRCKGGHGTSTWMMSGLAGRQAVWRGIEAGTRAEHSMRAAGFDSCVLLLLQLNVARPHARTQSRTPPCPCHLLPRDYATVSEVRTLSNVPVGLDQPHPCLVWYFGLPHTADHFPHDCVAHSVEYTILNIRTERDLNPRRLTRQQRLLELAVIEAVIDACTRWPLPATDHRVTQVVIADSIEITN